MEDKIKNFDRNIEQAMNETCGYAPVRDVEPDFCRVGAPPRQRRSHSRFWATALSFPKPR